MDDDENDDNDNDDECGDIVAAESAANRQILIEIDDEGE